MVLKTGNRVRHAQFGWCGTLSGLRNGRAVVVLDGGRGRRHVAVRDLKQATNPRPARPGGCFSQLKEYGDARELYETFVEVNGRPPIIGELAAYVGWQMAKAVVDNARKRVRLKEK